MLALIALFHAGLALAGTPIVHDGDSEAARARVAELTGADPASLDPVGLEELLRGRPAVLLGAGSIEPCGGAPARAPEVAEALADAEAHVAYMAFDEASEDIERAASRLACLADPVEATSAARVHFLRGMVAFGRGQEDVALSELRQAVLFDPELSWDEAFPPEGEALLDRARAAVEAAAPVSLRIVPSQEGRTVRVDGREIAADGPVLPLGEGVHLVQVGRGGLTTIRLTLPAGEEPRTLVLPALVPPGATRWVADPDRQEDLTLVLASVLGEGRAVHVVRDESAWSGTSGETEWTPLAAEAPEPVASPSPKRRTPWLTMGGGVVAVAGGSVALLTHGPGQSLAAQARETSNPETHASLEADYRPLRTANNVGLAMAGAGVALAGVGLAVELVGVEVLPLPSGLVLRVRR